MKSKKVSEIRTQIYLPKSLHSLVKKIAEGRGVSMATVIREGVELKVGEPSPEYQVGENDLMEVAGMIKNEPPDLSRNISKYVGEMYQEEK